MAFDISEMNKKNTPVRWKIQAQRMADAGAEGIAEMDALEPTYKAALEKAATFMSDDEMGIGNQPGIGSEADPVLVTGITLTGASATYEFDDATPANNKLNFSADVLPVDADDATFTFSSSDSGVISVTETYGLVELVTAGTATITVTANDGSGVSDSIEITVTNDVAE